MDNKDYKIINWKTETIRVDIETGLLIGKKEQIRDYIILKKTKRYEKHGNYGLVKHIYECKRNRQLELF